MEPNLPAAGRGDLTLVKRVLGQFRGWTRTPEERSVGGCSTTRVPASMCDEIWKHPQRDEPRVDGVEKGETPPP
jgi:hypothetical protein